MGLRMGGGGRGVALRSLSEKVGGVFGGASGGA